MRLPTRIEAYTRFVSIIKLLCAVAAIALVFVLVVLPLVNPAEKRVKFKAVTVTEAPPQASAGPHMTAPRFHGIDTKGQPYNVMADNAFQRDKDTVILTYVNADMTLSDQTWLSLLADQAVFTVSKKQLALEGHINVFLDNGYEFHTHKAEVDLLQGTAIGNEPVEGQGPLGVLRAKGFKAVDQWEVITFTGPVSLTLYP